MDEKVKLIFGDEPKLLQKYAKNKKVLELGAFHGYSTCLFAEVADIVISIDTFEMSGWNGNERKSTLNEFLKNTTMYSNIGFLKGTTNEIFKLYGDKLQNFDVLFVDADHSFEQALQDLMHYCQCIKPDGIIIMHDVFGEWYGVYPAALIYFGNKTMLEQCNTIGVWKNQKSINCDLVISEMEKLQCSK